MKHRHRWKIVNKFGIYDSAQCGCGAYRTATNKDFQKAIKRLERMISWHTDLLTECVNCILHSRVTLKDLEKYPLLKEQIINQMDR